MAVKELTARERNECIGCAIDANLEMYHSFLNGDGFKFNGDCSERNIGAAILTMAKWGYVDDYFDVYEGDNVAPHMKFRWGRSVLRFDGFTNEYTLDLFDNNGNAAKEFSNDA